MQWKHRRDGGSHQSQSHALRAQGLGPLSTVPILPTFSHHPWSVVCLLIHLYHLLLYVQCSYDAFSRLLIFCDICPLLISYGHLPEMFVKFISVWGLSVDWMKHGQSLHDVTCLFLMQSNVAHRRQGAMRTLSLLTKSYWAPTWTPLHSARTEVPTKTASPKTLSSNA